MNIFLIGFMGSGKSTVGKKLASRLGYAFLDMDAEIERQENRTIQAIFSESGEDTFREIETSWLEALKTDNAVIATGGGAPCREGNLARMKKKGVTVYLRSTPEHLASRLLNTKTSRPVIDPVKHDLPALQNLVRNLLEQRKPFYEQCDLVVDSISMHADKLDALISSVKQKAVK